MILVAVIVGYILGAMPFVLPRILEIIEKRKEEKKANTPVIDENQQEILDEWLNGPKHTNGVNQEDIYKEYVTGQETRKGG